MKKLFTLLALIAVAGMANAQVLVYEDFNYSVGNLVPSNGSWTKHSGTEGQTQVTAGSLTFADYPANASSNKIALTSANSEDFNISYTAQSTAGTKVYASFLINVSSTNATGQYFAHFQNGISNFSGRLWAKTIGAGVDFGIAGTGTATFLGTEFALNTTHLVVMSYEIVNGSANDIVKLWINPVLTGVEPAALATVTSATDLATVVQFGFRQASSMPTCTVDELKIGLTWADAPLPISLVKFTADKIAEKVKIQWTTATEINNEKFIIERSADAENFEVVTIIKGAGNSKELNTYSVVDANPLKGTSYYRLTQKDFNGLSETFAPVAVRMDAKNIELSAGVIDRSASSIPLNIFSPTATEATITVRDLNGRTISKEKILLTEGYQIFNLSSTNIGAGIQLIQLSTSTDVVIKKLTL